MSQRNSDALPFTQVDRAVKAKAAVLASAIGINYQHALGSLIEFWDLNGDPRELEKLVANDMHEVVLDGPEVQARFKIASGQDVSPETLTRIGFLEPIESRFRVRGMSRYFKPVEKALMRRQVGKVGGLASAEARKAKTGTSQPVRALVRPLVEQSSSNPEATLEPSPKQTRSKPEANPEANGNTESREQRAESVLRTYVGEFPPIDKTPPRSFVIEPPIKPIEAWGAEDFWRWAQHRRQESGLLPEKWPHPARLSAWWSIARQAVTTAALCEAFDSFGNDKHWESAKPPYPFGGFIDQWDRHVPAGGLNGS